MHSLSRGATIVITTTATATTTIIMVEGPSAEASEGVWWCAAFPFNIPENAFAVVALREVAALLRALGDDRDGKLAKLAALVRCDDNPWQLGARARC